MLHTAPQFSYARVGQILELKIALLGKVGGIDEVWPKLRAWALESSPRQNGQAVEPAW